MGITDLLLLVIVYNVYMKQGHQAMLDKFGDEMRNVIIEYEEKYTECDRKYRAEKLQNNHLRDKLERMSNVDINKSELYLVNKIERLEREVKERDELITVLRDRECA